MKEINIARTIINKRRERGITQDELANFIGVSKASVSKWETGHSYPDIVFLPQLAAYFNISLDELMGYQPQMTKKDIDKLYLKLYEDFSYKPFDEVVEECRESIKKYFSCFPLLLDMGRILLGASGVSSDSDKEKSIAFAREAKELFIRVKTESDNAELMKSALYMEALCASMLGDFEEVIELLGDSIVPASPHDVLLSSAYRMSNKNVEAETILQVSIYQNVTSALNLLSAYIHQGVEDTDRFDEIVKRALSIIDTFNIKNFQPSLTVNFYLTAAQGYLLRQNTEKSLDLLEEYAKFVASDISMELKGDSFFNLIDEWLGESDMRSTIIPSIEKNMKQVLANAVINSSLFSDLNNIPRFQSIAKRLKSLC